jgi:Uma2 family endonuclease
MAQASASAERSMTVAEFLAWSEGFGREERYELVRGVPARLMAPTIIRHARVQRNVAEALRAALATAHLRCEVFENGPGVAVDEQDDECRIPDVVVTCAKEIDETARLVP